MLQVITIALRFDKGQTKKQRPGWGWRWGLGLKRSISSAQHLVLYQNFTLFAVLNRSLYLNPIVHRNLDTESISNFH